MMAVMKSFLKHLAPPFWNVHKNFRKTNISDPLIRKCTSAYWGVRNVSFTENVAYAPNG